MDQVEAMRCPFVYATGKRCTGHVTFAKSFGGRWGGPIKKVRLWCSEKGNHEGGISSWAGKERMEFYPDKLPADIRSRVLSLFDGGVVETPV